MQTTPRASSSECAPATTRAGANGPIPRPSGHTRRQLSPSPTSHHLPLQSPSQTGRKTWWYKTSSAGFCKGPVFSNATTATDLDAESQYTITAFSQAGCSQVIVTSDSFNTQPAQQGNAISVTKIRKSDATITRSGFTGDWYYKADKEPHTQCSSAVTTDSVKLIGLASVTTYSYSAYSDATCATELASTSFTTTGKAIPIVQHNANEITIDIVPLGAERWSYKRKLASDADFQDCVNPDDDDTTITGLKADTTASVKVYRQLNCPDPDLSGAIAIRTPKASMAVNIHSTSPTITISKWINQKWYYQQESPVEGSCSDEVAAGTYNAQTSAGLTPGTEYRYDAYEDSSCTDSISDATVTFTIAEFTGAPGTTTAVLQLNHWDKTLVVQIHRGLRFKRRTRRVEPRTLPRSTNRKRRYCYRTRHAATPSASWHTPTEPHVEMPPNISTKLLNQTLDDVLDRRPRRASKGKDRHRHTSLRTHSPTEKSDSPSGIGQRANPIGTTESMSSLRRPQ